MAWAYVQSVGKHVGSPGVTNQTLAYSSSVTAGSLLVCFTIWKSHSVTLTINDSSDSNATNWTDCDTGPFLLTGGTLGPYSMQAFYRPNAPGGATTVKWVQSADMNGNEMNMNVIEYSGLDTGSPLDIAASYNEDTTHTSGNAAISNSITPATNELVLSYLFPAGGDSNSNAGWTRRLLDPISGAIWDQNGAGSSTSSQPVFTGGGDNGLVIMSFKLPGGTSKSDTDSAGSGADANALKAVISAVD